MKSNSSRSLFLLLLCISLNVLAGCVTVEMSDASLLSEPTVIVLNQQPTSTSMEATAQPTASVNQVIPPTSVGSFEEEVEDTNSSKFASERRVVSGDSYLSNFYERPFTSQTMDYLPAVDIQYGYISTDNNYFIYTIVLAGVDTNTHTLLGSYGVEMDIDADGRGDYSIWVKDPVSTSWTSENVRIFKDTNNDVGGKDKYTSDAPSFGDGYDLEIPNTSEKAVFARILPDNSSAVQIAVSQGMVENPSEFLWGLWADNGIQDPRQFDYDDHYTYKDAGSPIVGNRYYPLRVVHSCDNTCRRPYGFSPDHRIPNMCWSGGAVLPTSTASILPTPTH